MNPAALNMAQQVLGHARFLFVHLAREHADRALCAALDAVSAALENMHHVDGQPSEEASQRGRFQYLRLEAPVSEWQVPDPGISRANALIRLEGRRAEPLLAYERELRALIEPRGGAVHARAGVRKERSYTSYAMTQWAYARAFPPKRGSACPFGVVTPQNKTAEWWAMDWMRRESLFLPRYDDHGRISQKGHALACAAGIPCLTRRLVHHPEGYGLGGGYDFIGYFEFAESDAPVFREVMAGLRDRDQNPEWSYVREGPEWWGRRVAEPHELWASCA
jgi:hypothetical protein